MNKGLKRVGATVLAASLVMGSLAGCSKKSAEFDADAVAITINEETVSAGVVKFASHYVQAQYQYYYDMYFGDNSFSYEISTGYTIGDSTRESVVEEIQEMVLARQHAEDYGVELTDEEIEAISTAAGTFISENSEEVLELMSATQEIVEEYLTLVTYQVKVEAAIEDTVDTEVSDEEAAQRRVQYVYVAAETEDEEAESETEEDAEVEVVAVEEVTDDAEEAEEETEAAAETEVAVAEEEEIIAETEVAEEAAETEVVEEAAETEAVEEATTEAEEETAAAEAETTVDDADLEDNDADKTQSADETEVSETEIDEEIETETETEDPAWTAAMEEAYVKASLIIALVESGSDLYDAAAAVDEDLSVVENTFGSDSTAIKDCIIEATEGIGDETLISYPVEADEGYYVCYVVSELDRDATDEKKEEIIEERKEELVDTAYEEWEEAADIASDEDVIATITFDFNLTPYEEEETEADETEVYVEAESETE